MRSKLWMVIVSERKGLSSGALTYCGQRSGSCLIALYKVLRSSRTKQSPQCIWHRLLMNSWQDIFLVTPWERKRRSEKVDKVRRNKSVSNTKLVSHSSSSKWTQTNHITVIYTNKLSNNKVSQSGQINLKDNCSCSGDDNIHRLYLCGCWSGRWNLVVFVGAKSWKK